MFRRSCEVATFFSAPTNMVSPGLIDVVNDHQSRARDTKRSGRIPEAFLAEAPVLLSPDGFARAPDSHAALNRRALAAAVPFAIALGNGSLRRFLFRFLFTSLSLFITRVFFSEDEQANKNDKRQFAVESIYQN